MVPTPAAFKIGDVPIAGPCVQAALSGYSDLAMRLVARAYGAPYAVHEVVLDRLVLQKGKGRNKVLQLAAEDHPVGGQLMGSEPETFGAAAKELVGAGFDVVDINFGCPVAKVLGRCRGGYLLSTPEVALDIVQRVVDAVQGDVPVTVKMRRGYDDTLEAEQAFFTILEGCFQRGVAAVTVHGRTVVQRYNGPSNTAFLKRVKQHVGDHVVLGSGDLYTAADVMGMLKSTGVDGVTAARGCIGNPFLFREVAALQAGQAIVPPTPTERLDALLLHWHHAKHWFGPGPAAKKVRTHAIRAAAYAPDPEAARDGIAKSRCAESLALAMCSAFGEPRRGALPLPA